MAVVAAPETVCLDQAAFPQGQWSLRLADALDTLSTDHAFGGGVERAGAWRIVAGDRACPYTCHSVRMADGGWRSCVTRWDFTTVAGEEPWGALG
jgi:hypothetical protein